jgi:hypothetical protein
MLLVWQKKATLLLLISVTLHAAEKAEVFSLAGCFCIISFILKNSWFPLCSCSKSLLNHDRGQKLII